MNIDVVHHLTLFQGVSVETSACQRSSSVFPALNVFQTFILEDESLFANIGLFSNASCFVLKSANAVMHLLAFADLSLTAFQKVRILVWRPLKFCLNGAWRIVRQVFLSSACEGLFLVLISACSASSAQIAWRCALMASNCAIFLAFSALCFPNTQFNTCPVDFFLCQFNSFPTFPLLSLAEAFKKPKNPPWASNKMTW